jgi:amino acid transporter
MEPVSYWPIELTLDASILYLLANSRSVYEIAFLMIALVMHIKRQWESRQLIREVSDRKPKFFILALLVAAAGVVWATRNAAWPLPVWIAAATGVAYFWATMEFVKDSGKSFKLFDPKIDLPQMLVSATMAWIAFQNKNPVSILWLTDFVYHVLETAFT